MTMIMWSITVVVCACIAAAVAGTDYAVQEHCKLEAPVLECRARLPTSEEICLLERAAATYNALELHDVSINETDYSARLDRLFNSDFYLHHVDKLRIDNSKDLLQPLWRRKQLNVSRNLSEPHDVLLLCSTFGPRLSVLEWNHNKPPLQESSYGLVRILKSFLQCFPKLTSLSLAGNSIYFSSTWNLDDESLRLESLDLSDNGLPGFDKDFFARHLPNLTKLSLTGNRLEIVRNDWQLGSLAKLAELNISRNRLEMIMPNVFDELSLEILDVSDNKIVTFDGVFKSIKNKCLKRLNLAGNRLKVVQAEWFKDFTKLEELDISRNKLTSIQADTLQPLTSLSVLKVAENPLIERDLSFLLGTGRNLDTVDASRIGLVRIPATLTRSVRTLKLVGNRLIYITSGDLDSYPLLESLDLSDNRIQNIEEDALGRLDGLQELVLSRNILPAVPKSLSIQLKILDLRQNAISKLHAKDLQGLSRLKILNLSGNVIDSIEGEFFRQLTALESLDISENPIKKLPSDTLSGPTALHTLRMSDLWMLKTEANQNHDTAFPILALESLVTLDVSRSPVLAAQLLADDAALSACKRLEELDLSYTGITSLRSDLAYVLPELRKLNLIGNMWNCTPDQFWLGQWTRERRVSRVVSTRCKTPPKLEGKLLEEMRSPSDHAVTTPTLNNSSTTTTTCQQDEARPSSEEPTSSTTATMQSTTFDVPLFSTNTAAREQPSTRKNLKEINSSSTATATEINRLQTSAAPASSAAGTEEAISVTNEEAVKTTTAAAAAAKFFEKLVGYSKVSNSITTTTTSSRSSFKAGTTTTEKAEELPGISPSISSELEKPIGVTNEEAWSSSTSTTYQPTTTTSESSEQHVSKAVNYTSSREHATGPIIDLADKQRNNNESLTSTTTSLDKTSSEEDNNAAAVTATASFPATAEMKETKRKKIVLSERAKKYKTKKCTILSDLDRKSLTAKILSANEEEPAAQPARAARHESVVAEELNGRVTSDESRILVAEELNGPSASSPSFAGAGAHPGMLILLGAALAGAAVLTVVLSRRATVTRRDSQYQRHENIEVHALTPTTELW